MSDWNPQQYLRFVNERTQPVYDLISRVHLDAPGRILDLGCGPGNSTAALKARWPGAKVVGLDSSKAMVEQARCDHPALEFVIGDACNDLSELGRFDLVFANASLQWMPDHSALVPRLFGMVERGGALAVQVPQYDQMPISRVVDEVAASPEWAPLLLGVRSVFEFHAEGFYFDVLSPLTEDVQLWVTDYCHVMRGHEDIVTMIEFTGLRPYLDRLDGAQAMAFKRSVKEKLRSVYPTRQSGRVLFPFRRLFVIAAHGR